MSKYNLHNLLSEMTNDEFRAAEEADRLEAHPESNKIKAIMALMAKEKNKNNKFLLLLLLIILLVLLFLTLSLFFNY